MDAKAVKAAPRTRRRQGASPDGDLQALLSLPFDCYQRYAVTQKIVTLLWRRKRRRLRILDVGGHSSLLKNFLAGEEVILTDVQAPPPFTHLESIPFRHDGYILAAGQSLPFAPGSFDLVTAHDTLEHIPQKVRPDFLRELLRVARSFVILNGPVYHPETARAEERLAQFFKRALSWDHPYLREHLYMGLPNTELIDDLLRERGLTFIRIPNGNLTRWVGMMAMKHFVMMFPASDRSGEIIDRTYNTLVSPRDFGGLCYREAYVVAKDQRGADALGRVEAAFSPRQTPPPAARNLDRQAPIELRAIDEFLDILADRAQAMRRAQADQRDTIRALEGTISDLHTALAERDALLAEKDSVLADNSHYIAQLETRLAATEDELRQARRDFELVTSTLGYRLMEQIRSALRWLFPPGSWRRRLYKALQRPVRWLLKRR